MKHVPFSETLKHSASVGVIVSEYGGNERIDGAYAEINGTYPLLDWAVNEESDMQFFVHEGEGKFTIRYENRETGAVATREVKIALGKRAMVLVERGERYRIEGDGLGVFIASTPPWSPDQARVVSE